MDLSRTESLNLTARAVRRQGHPGVAARLRVLELFDLEDTQVVQIDTVDRAVRKNADKTIFEARIVYTAGVLKVLAFLVKSIFVDETSKFELRETFYRDMR